jgi:site-specific DNA recombinase
MANINNIKRIAVYARVSTSKQEDDGTIETQIQAIEEYAQKNGYLIVERYYDNGWSGDTLVRPEIDRLRLEIKNANYDAVLSYDRDRIARRYSYQEIVIDEIVEARKQVIFVTSEAPKNQEDKILFGVKGLFAEYERAKITERMRIGKLRKVRQGVPALGDVPYGYDYIKKIEDGGSGSVKINEDEAKNVRLIFHLVANQKFTIKKVIERLRDLGIKPRKSKRGVWANSTLNRMLKKSVYTGEGYWNVTASVVPKNPYKKDEKYRKVKKTGRIKKPSDEWVPVNFPPIIDKELFEKTQEQVRLNGELCFREKINKYLLGGVIYCNCGKRRTGDGNIKSHLYYRCIDRILKHPLPRTCFEGSINVVAIDQIMWQLIVDLLINEDLLKTQLERWNNKQPKQDSFEIIQTERLENEYKAIEIKEDKHNDAYASGLYTIAQLKKYTDPLKERKIQILESLSKLRENKVKIESSVKVAKVEDVQDLTEKIKSAIINFDFKTKKVIIQALIDKIRIRGIHVV